MTEGRKINKDESERYIDDVINFSDLESDSQEEKREDSDGFSSYSSGEELEGKGNEVPWVRMYCGLKGNEFFCEITEKFIQDTFNLNEIEDVYSISFFDLALDTILDLDSTKYENLNEEDKQSVDSSAETIYGILHSRYILSPEGLEKMSEKFKNQDFGTCPRVLCEDFPVLPFCPKDTPGLDSVKIYCEKCRGVYNCPGKHLIPDGSYWGSTFASYFFMTYPDLKPKEKKKNYVPLCFGFKIHKYEEDVRNRGEETTPEELESGSRSVESSSGVILWNKST